MAWLRGIYSLPQRAWRISGALKRATEILIRSGRSILRAWSTRYTSRRSLSPISTGPGLAIGICAAHQYNIQRKCILTGCCRASSPPKTMVWRSAGTWADRSIASRKDIILETFKQVFMIIWRTFWGSALPAQRALQIAAGILGDPTLRWFGVEPPTLRSKSHVGSEVTLKWTPASNPETCYCVLRSGTEDGPFVELSNSPVNVPEIVDAPAPANVFYQIRTATLTHTGCGSFWNPSQSLKINVP